MIDLLASDRADARARVRRDEIILLDAARTRVRTSCEIGDAKTRRWELLKVSRPVYDGAGRLVEWYENGRPVAISGAREVTRESERVVGPEAA